MPSLRLTHRTQSHEADCLAACAWMVLNYWEINVRYPQLLNLLKVHESGASFYSLDTLTELHSSLSVHIQDAHMELLAEYLHQGRPVIASVNTIELPYWQGQDESHAVVVVHLDESTVSLHDPWYEDAPQVVNRMHFESAWLHHEYLCAIIERT